MCGINYIALSGLTGGIRYQRGRGPLFANNIPSGLHQEADSPKETAYNNPKGTTYNSPEGTRYNSPKGAI